MRIKCNLTGDCDEDIQSVTAPLVKVPQLWEPRSIPTTKLFILTILR